MNKLFLIPILVGLLGLAGCDGDVQIVKKDNYIVVTPPAILYNCPKVTVPNVNTLTNKQIASFILKQYEANVTCRNNMASIQTYIEKAKKIYIKQ
jgi:hypothetical protein